MTVESGWTPVPATRMTVEKKKTPVATAPVTVETAGSGTALRAVPGRKRGTLKYAECPRAKGGRPRARVRRYAPAFTGSANRRQACGLKASTGRPGPCCHGQRSPGGVAYFDALAAVVPGIARLAPGYGALPVHRSSATLAISSREAPLGRASLWRDL